MSKKSKKGFVALIGLLTLLFLFLYTTRPLLINTKPPASQERPVGANWKTHVGTLSDRNISYPFDWFVLKSSEAEFLVSNASSNVVYKNTTYIPNAGQVIIRFAFIHSATENYSPGKHLITSPSQAGVVKWGRYLDGSGSFAIETYYRDKDKNIEGFEDTIESILIKNEIVSAQ